MTRPAVRTPRWFSVPAALGVVAMGGIVAWGIVEQRARAADNLGGRVPIAMPADAPRHHADVCRIAGRCDTPLAAIRWYAVVADTLPAVICPAAGYELVGCYEPSTKALTLAAGRERDSLTLRHELMHAALADWRKMPGGNRGAVHECRYFNSTFATGWPSGDCG